MNKKQRSKFIKHLEWASKIVASWPPWKRHTLSPYTDLDIDAPALVELQQLYVNLDAIDEAIEQCMYREGVRILQKARARVLGEIKQLERKRTR